MRSEFEFINHIKDKYSLKVIGDDCAVLPRDGDFDMVVTADMLVEDIDFRLDWTTPEFLGHKALAVSLSDVAAMGAKPLWAMLSIAVPESLWNTDFLDRFYGGWHALANEHRVKLVGGDISRTPDKLVIDSIVGGEAGKGKAILRRGAEPGDLIFVSGGLGGAAGGLRLLEDGQNFRGLGDDPKDNLILRQLQSIPQVSIGNLLQSHGLATSMIDLSDGLSSDLVHLMEASETGCILDLDDVPVADHLCDIFTADDARQMALNGGEDFELLFTVKPEDEERVSKLGFTRIGLITSAAGSYVVVSGKTTSPLTPAGYQHFV